MKQSAPEIKALHEELCRKFRACLRISPQSSIMIAPDGGDSGGWDRSKTGTKVPFVLINPGYVERARRTRGNPQPVFIIPGFNEDSPSAWVGWYEEWIKERDKFDLIGVSLSFYWGLGRSRPKQELIRAEWDKVSHRPSPAAQPHWHIDHRFVMEFPGRASLDTPSLAPANDTSDELVEIGTTDALVEVGEEDTGLVEIGPAGALQDLSMAAMHLAMGGWQHAAASPARWQRLLDTPKCLVEWAECTLLYAIQELERIDAGNVVA
jgi:hypothetical protein